MDAVEEETDVTRSPFHWDYYSGCSDEDKDAAEERLSSLHSEYSKSFVFWHHSAQDAWFIRHPGETMWMGYGADGSPAGCLIEGGGPPQNPGVLKSGCAMA